MPLVPVQASTGRSVFGLSECRLWSEYRCQLLSSAHLVRSPQLASHRAQQSTLAAIRAPVLLAEADKQAIRCWEVRCACELGHGHLPCRLQKNGLHYYGLEQRYLLKWICIILISSVVMFGPICGVIAGGCTLYNSEMCARVQHTVCELQKGLTWPGPDSDK